MRAIVVYVMSATKYPFSLSELECFEDINDEGKEDADRKVRESLTSLRKTEPLIQPTGSFLELRGVLKDATDEEGRKGTEMLRAARKYDKQKDRKITRRHFTDTDE